MQGAGSGCIIYSVLSYNRVSYKLEVLQTEKLQFMVATSDFRDFFSGDSTQWEEFRTLLVFIGSPFFAEI
jgi:hypothetical protein